MHELSICGAIKDIVAKHAGSRPVKTIHLQVGQLRQVVPDTLTYCWSLVTAETPLAESSLEIDHIPAMVECRACGHVTAPGDFPVMRCERCDGTDVAVTAGEEFLITSLDLVEGVNS